MSIRLASTEVLRALTPDGGGYRPRVSYVAEAPTPVVEGREELPQAIWARAPNIAPRLHAFVSKAKLRRAGLVGADDVVMAEPPLPRVPSEAAALRAAKRAAKRARDVSPVLTGAAAAYGAPPVAPARSSASAPSLPGARRRVLAPLAGAAASGAMVIPSEPADNVGALPGSSNGEPKRARFVVPTMASAGSGAAGVRRGVVGAPGSVPPSLALFWAKYPDLTPLRAASGAGGGPMASVVVPQSIARAVSVTLDKAEREVSASRDGGVRAAAAEQAVVSSAMAWINQQRRQVRGIARFQALWRMFPVRVDYLRQRAVAIKIQSLVRTRLARERLAAVLAARREAAGEIMRFAAATAALQICGGSVQGHLLARSAREVLQSWRSYVVRVRIVRKMFENSSLGPIRAVLIAWHEYARDERRERKEVDRLRSLHLNLRKRIYFRGWRRTIRIQAFLRRRLHRMQRGLAWRAYRGWASQRGDRKRASLEVQRVFRGHRIRRRLRAAEKITRPVRGFLFRMHVYKYVSLVKFKAAVRLQANWRAGKSREAAARERVQRLRLEMLRVVAERRECWRAADLAEAQARLWIATIDGMLALEAAAKEIAKRQSSAKSSLRKDPDAWLRLQFDLFDVDGRGALNATGFCSLVCGRLLEPLTEPEALEVFRALDTQHLREVMWANFSRWYHEDSPAARRGCFSRLAHAFKRAKARRGAGRASLKAAALPSLVIRAGRNAYRERQVLFRRARPPRLECARCGNGFALETELDGHTCFKDNLWYGVNPVAKTTVSSLEAAARAKKAPQPAPKPK